MNARLHIYSTYVGVCHNFHSELNRVVQVVCIILVMTQTIATTVIYGNGNGFIPLTDKINSANDNGK